MSDNDEITDIIQLTERLATGGYWSGTEDRHHQHYIAIIPESRYCDSGKPNVAQDGVVDVATEYPPIPEAPLDEEWAKRVRKAARDFDRWRNKVRPPIVDRSLVRMWREEEDEHGRLIYVLGFKAIL